MIINFVGLFNKPGVVGEISDETHLAKELEKLGHTVNRIQRDEWKAYVDGEINSNWNLPIKADINLICKWHHFDTGVYIHRLRAASGEAPVFYWVWDFMPNPTIPNWHLEMAKAADLYLSGELGIFDQYKAHGVKPYYFQMDVCDGDIPTRGELYQYDVVFTGSCIDQGHRKEWLQEINKQISVTIFAWNPEEWFKLGFKECYPAVYGEEYNKVIAQSKIVLGFSVEPNCWGYWSNRIGKVTKAGGFLLQEYAPGMELILGDGVEYFNSPQEAIDKIKFYLLHEDKRDQVRARGFLEIGPRLTSSYKVIQLSILMERYLKAHSTSSGQGGDKWLL